MNNPTLWSVVALVAVALVIAAVFQARRRAKARTAGLQRRFGPEYDRAVEEMGSARAEHELIARSRRVERFRFRDLDATDRARFTANWSRIQAQFVDEPAAAVANANELINEVMRARGYPTDDFEQRVADLSVDHPTVIEHYRAAHALAESNHEKSSSTEELRQAVVHYRVLFADLLQDPNASRRPMHDATDLVNATRTGTR